MNTANNLIALYLKKFYGWDLKTSVPVMYSSILFSWYMLLCQGEIALAFGDLLRKLWAPGASPVSPRIFKSKLARFAPQFSGFNQHDSQVSVFGPFILFLLTFLALQGS